MALTLPTLSSAEISALLAQQSMPRNNKPKNYYIVRTSAGTLEKKSGRPPANDVGKFEGKAGTMCHSRKGRTYRSNNGTRKYMTMNTDSNVVAYMTRP